MVKNFAGNKIFLIKSMDFFDTDQNDKQDFHIGLSSKNGSYNRTMIWLTIIFFIVSILLSVFFMYLPIYRIETKIDDTIKKDQERFDKINTFIDGIEPQVDGLIIDAKNLVSDICNSTAKELLGGAKALCGVLGGDFANLAPGQFASLGNLTPNQIELLKSLTPSQVASLGNLTTPSGNFTTSTTSLPVIFDQ